MGRPRELHLLACNDVVAPLAVVVASRTRASTTGAAPATITRRSPRARTWTIWKGLGAGMVFRRYSGYPVNETTGVDTNGDGTNNDRPVKGANDATMPIDRPLDAKRHGRSQRHRGRSTN